MADDEYTPTLEAVRDAAAARMRAQVAGDADETAAATQRMQEAAQAAIGAGDSIGAVYTAETIGASNAGKELAPEVRKAIAKAGARYRTAGDELLTAARRGLALGLAQREVAREAGLSPAAARTLLAARGETSTLPSSDGTEASGESNDGGATSEGS